jgi:[acyl-carrier-protein] S-malonyltransferase
MTLALVFPGQGAQYVGMAKDLAAQVPAAGRILAEAEAALGLPLGKLMAEGPEAELTRTDISQPVILVASLMALAALEARGMPAFAACAGLSLGEYTALVAAGAIGAGDAVRLVRLRGQAMQDAATATPSGMVALIGADEAAAARLCSECAHGEVLQIANLNSPGQIVISGAAAACARSAAAVGARGKELGIRKAIPLPVAGAFHSALMAPAAARLEAALASVRIQAPRVSVYANVTGAANRDPARIPALLVEQLTRPVRWADEVVAMHRDGVHAFLELGPKATLGGMIARTVSGVTCASIDTAADLAKPL